MSYLNYNFDYYLDTIIKRNKCELRDLVFKNTILKKELLTFCNKNKWNYYFYKLYDTSKYEIHINIFNLLNTPDKRYKYNLQNLQNSIDFFKKENIIIKQNLTLECLFNIGTNLNDAYYNYPNIFPTSF